MASVRPIFLNGALGGMVSGDNEARTQQSSRVMGLELASLVRELVLEGVSPAQFDFFGETRRLEASPYESGVSGADGRWAAKAS